MLIEARSEVEAQSEGGGDGLPRGESEIRGDPLEEPVAAPPVPLGEAEGSSELEGAPLSEIAGVALTQALPLLLAAAASEALGGGVIVAADGEAEGTAVTVALAEDAFCGEGVPEAVPSGAEALAQGEAESRGVKLALTDTLRVGLPGVPVGEMLAAGLALGSGEAVGVTLTCGDSEGREDLELEAKGLTVKRPVAVAGPGLCEVRAEPVPPPPPPSVPTLPGVAVGGALTVPPAELEAPVLALAKLVPLG